MFLTLEKLYLELIYLLKGESGFDKNDILMEGKYNVIQAILRLLSCGFEKWRLEEVGLSLFKGRLVSPILRGGSDSAPESRCRQTL